MCFKTTLLPPVWPRDTKRLDTPENPRSLCDLGLPCCASPEQSSSYARRQFTLLWPVLVSHPEILLEFEGRGEVVTMFMLSLMFPAGRNARTPEAGFPMWTTTLGPLPGSAPQQSMCGTTSSGSRSGISSRAPCSTSAKDSSTR